MRRKKVVEKRSPEIVDTEFLCSYFGVARLTILNWRKNRDLPWFYEEIKEFGARRAVRFEKRKVMEWARIHEVKTAGTRISIKKRREKNANRRKKKASGQIT